jgi:hypothetical protein
MAGGGVCGDPVMVAQTVARHLRPGAAQVRLDVLAQRGSTMARACIQGL